MPAEFGNPWHSIHEEKESKHRNNSVYGIDESARLHRVNPKSTRSHERFLSRTDHDGIACLCFHNPPVNALDGMVRTALHQALDALEEDSATQGVVIYAEGRLFSGGGDLREIGREAGAETIDMAALTSRIEGFAKPVVVAMHGKAIGGGVLLALACHARIGSSDASILLPEVNLAFPPGAGGTQRLPRLVGLEVAMRMAALAESLDAASACAAGFYDEIVPDAAAGVHAALRRARAIAEAALPWRRTGLLQVPPVVGGGDKLLLAAQYRAIAERVFPGREAPLVAISLVLAACEADLETGMRRERAEYLRLSGSEEARALIAQVLARRSSGKS